jgi:hypothetical protein
VFFFPSFLGRASEAETVVEPARRGKGTSSCQLVLLCCGIFIFGAFNMWCQYGRIKQLTFCHGLGPSSGHSLAYLLVTFRETRRCGPTCQRCNVEVKRSCEGSGSISDPFFFLFSMQKIDPAGLKPVCSRTGNYPPRSDGPVSLLKAQPKCT